MGYIGEPEKIIEVERAPAVPDQPPVETPQEAPAEKEPVGV